MITLRPVLAADAPILFPMIHGTRVTDTILWDGPASLEELTAGLAEREKKVRAGELFLYTICLADSGQPIGTADVRPTEQKFRGDCGLWIGEAYHGKGYGTRVVAELKRIAFEQVKMEKLEAGVFVGNIASRRIFEKNGFQLEGTLRKSVKKRGKLLDEWIFGITRTP
jgi:RimJ/RimL family protein N-acetyltransferase